MSVARVAHHKTNAVELRQQRDIPYLLKDEPGSHARGGVEEHGPCAPAIALRVVDARHAFDHVVKNCAQPYDVADKMLDWPALLGIGE